MADRELLRQTVKVTNMNGGSLITSYEIPVFYETGLKRVRRALLDQDVRVSAEFDGCEISGTLLGAGPVFSYRILCVDSPLLMLEAIAIDPAAAVFIPVHVVVSADGPNTRVDWINLENIQGRRLPLGAIPPLRSLQAQIRRAVAGVPCACDVSNPLVLSR